MGIDGAYYHLLFVPGKARCEKTSAREVEEKFLCNSSHIGSHPVLEG